MSVPDLRYPIGPFTAPADAARPETVSRLTAQIAELPQAIRRAVAGLSDAQLDTPYREHGWTVRQLVHHVADSHMNAYVRFKLALTSDVPRINAYDEKVWALLPDTRLPLDPSLQLLDGLHARWVTLLRAVPASDFARTFEHPERGIVPLHDMVALYAWHGRHHTAHITELRGRMGW